MSLADSSRSDRSSVPIRGAGGEGSGTDLDLVQAVLERAVARSCPAWLRGLKEDIVQGAMVRVLARLRNGAGNPGPPASYLWKAAHSATVDEIRRVSRRGDMPMESAGEATRDAASEQPDPQRSLELRELGESIEACLQRLKEPRRLVVGFHLMGHTLDETSHLTGWDGKKVRNLLYRGMANLRSCLAARGIEP